MANLYKKALILRDPDTGKRTPYKTDKWWARYRDAHGATKRVAFSENKNIAQRMLADILQNVELEKSGVITNGMNCFLGKPRMGFQNGRNVVLSLAELRSAYRRKADRDNIFVVSSATILQHLRR